MCGCGGVCGRCVLLVRCVGFGGVRGGEGRGYHGSRTGMGVK